MRRAGLGAAYRVLYVLRRAWFLVARPRTFGVRVLIRQRGTGAILLIRHSYGANHLWYPPGGGYRPAREAVEDAARREVREEVGIILGPLDPLGTYQTDKVGNRDTVALYQAEIGDAPINTSAEIAEHRWIQPDDLSRLPIGRVTQATLAKAGVAFSKR